MADNRPCKAELLDWINTMSFVCDDTKLFLDTHPCNTEALEFYEEFKLDAMICEMKLKIKFYSDSVFYMFPFMHKYIWNPTSVYIAERNYSYNMWR